MSERHDLVVGALARLRAEDERVAADAEAAFGSLTWGKGPEVIALGDVQRFLWYELPRKWMTDLDGKLHLASSLGRLFDLIGLPRYAAVCRSQQTARILVAYERDSRDGFRAFREAEERSGIAPPDLPELTWGPVMGVQEASAHTSVAGALELAVATGELRPGGRGWRAAQQALTRRHLTLPQAELAGRIWLDAIRDERLTGWARSRGTARRILIEPLTVALANPTPMPTGAQDAIAPLRWLLDGAAGGLRLTPKGNLARAIVIDAVNRVRLEPPAQPATRRGRRLRAVDPA
jgi:hypothetical protein